MSNFIYALTEEKKEELIAKGYKFIGKVNSNKTMYAFQNNMKMNFNKEDKKDLLFSNTMYF